MAHRGALLYSPRRGQGAATMTRERSSSSSRMGVGVGVGISDTEPLSLSTPSTAAYDESSSGAVHTREYQVSCRRIMGLLGGVFWLFRSFCCMKRCVMLVCIRHRAWFAIRM